MAVSKLCGFFRGEEQFLWLVFFYLMVSKFYNKNYNNNENNKDERKKKRGNKIKLSVGALNR